mgnify:CR=1 FL=1
MAKKLLFFFLFFLLVFNSSAQANDKIDSLLILQERTHKVEKRIDNYLALSKLYRPISIDTSRQMLEYALELALEIKSKKDLSRVYAGLGLFDVMIDSLDKAIYEYDQASLLYKELNELEPLCDILIIIGNIYYVQANYPEAMLKYNEALTYTKQINYTDKLPHCYNNLGVVHHSQKDFTQALEYFTTALELFDKLDDSLHVALLMGNIGSIYVNLNNIDIAKKYYINSMNVYDKLVDKEGKVIAMLQLSEIYILKNEPDSALILIEKSDSIYKTVTTGFRGPKATSNTEIQLNIAKSYMLKKDWSKAVTHADSCFSIATMANLEGSKIESAKLLSDVYDSIGNIDSAYKYFKKFKSYSDSLLSEDNIRNIAQMEFKYKYEQELIESELQKKRRTLILIIIVVGLMFALVVFVLLLKLEKNKKTKINIERLRLKDELEFKNKELTTHMLYLLKKNEFILNIGEKLKKIIPSIKIQNKKSIADVINELNSGSSNDTWKEFELRFQEVHTSFFDNLNKDYPDLSPNELRLCAFLRLNMSTKDISSITYQSVNSIEMARFRLRKKLGIDSNEHLVSFLSRL